MKRLTKRGIVTLILVLLFVFMPVVSVEATPLSLSSKSAILIDADTGKVLYKKNANEKRAIASTTKIMTAIVALENCELDEIVKISSKATRETGSKVYVSAGERYYLKDLLYALMLPSGNDVAVAIAEHVAGSESKFAKKMTKKAQKLGCKNTNFTNAVGHGDYLHKSTAKDMAIITKYAMENKTFRKIVKTKTYSFQSLSGRKFCIRNTNTMLNSQKGMVGVKTGSGPINMSGYCMVGAFQIKGKTYISVILGAPSENARFSDTRKLISYVKKH